MSELLYNEEDGGGFGLNLRYPVTFNIEDGIRKHRTELLQTNPDSQSRTLKFSTASRPERQSTNSNT